MGVLSRSIFIVFIVLIVASIVIGGTSGYIAVWLNETLELGRSDLRIDKIFYGFFGTPTTVSVFVWGFMAISDYKLNREMMRDTLRKGPRGAINRLGRLFVSLAVWVVGVGVTLSYLVTIALPYLNPGRGDDHYQMFFYVFSSMFVVAALYVWFELARFEYRDSWWILDDEAKH